MAQPQRIHVHNSLAEKASFDENIDLAEIFARADVALEGLGDEFIGWVNPETARLRDAVAQLRARPELWESLLDQAYWIAFEIKGQGTILGYPLLSEIGDSLCNFVRGMRHPRPAEIDVIDAHVGALRAVVIEQMQGGGGEIGAQVLRGLKIAVQKAGG